MQEGLRVRGFEFDCIGQVFHPYPGSNEHRKTMHCGFSNGCTESSKQAPDIRRQQSSRRVHVAIQYIGFRVMV